VRFNYLIMTVSKISSLLLAVAAAGLVSCASTSKDAEISKVNYYRFDSKKKLVTADPSISFEQKYYLYGAISEEEVAAREGIYFNVHWGVKDRSQPVKLVLQYRQAKTGAALYSKEVEPSSIKGSNTTEMSVIGDDWVKNGHVTAWKISLMRGKEEVAEHHSYLWQ
jgi:hypothetical protein